MNSIREASLTAHSLQHRLHFLGGVLPPLPFSSRLHWDKDIRRAYAATMILRTDDRYPG